MRRIVKTLAVSFMVASVVPSLAAAAENRQEDTVLDAASGSENVASGMIRSETPIKDTWDVEPWSPILLVKDAEDTPRRARI